MMIQMHNLDPDSAESGSRLHIWKCIWIQINFQKKFFSKFFFWKKFWSGFHLLLFPGIGPSTSEVPWVADIEYDFVEDAEEDSDYKSNFDSEEEDSNDIFDKIAKY